MRAIVLAFAGLGAFLVAPADAKRPQRVEGALGRTADIPPIVGMTSSADYTTSVVIHPSSSYDFGGMQWYDLTLGSATPGDGRPPIGIAVHEDLELAHFLQEHAGQRISLTLRASSPLTRDGEAR